MDKRKKLLLVGGLAALGGLALAMASGDANAAPPEPEDDDGPEPLPGDVPPGQSTVDLDDVAEQVDDILDGLPQVPLPPPAPPVVKPEPVNPPPPVATLPELPRFDTLPIPVAPPSTPIKVPVPVVPVPAKPAPKPVPPIVPPDNVSPIPLPPPNVIQPAPAPKPMAQPTLEMVRTLLAKERTANWKSLDEPTVRAWQRYRKLVVDGKLGPVGILALADETGLLPIVRAWPKGTWPEKAVPELRAKLEAKAMQAEEPRRSHLLAAVDRETGQAFGTPPKPITVTIEGV